jgi:alanyl-tRNA synthetase
MKVNDLRDAFSKFFQTRDHQRIPSASLIPHGDPTLLFTTAGMVQFKPYFLGLESPPSSRLTSIQRCFRTTDVEEVGDDDHLTLFEMLGNFSVGDYFKPEAIAWSWEFLTEILEIPADCLWATVYTTDDDAYKLWLGQGVPESRLLRYSAEQGNWWGPPGETGPMGPCSELHYDWGVNATCDHCQSGTCHPDIGCGRFLEIWNLVFMQYELLEDGSQIDLPAANIDTGAGLERLASVLQGHKSVYDTDELRMIVAAAESITSTAYEPEKNPAAAFALRAISEHARAFSFLVTDGVLPSNDGRGYVLRRLIRRAIYFGNQLGIQKPFFADVVDSAVEHSRVSNPELEERLDFMLELAQKEEARFRLTLDRGLSLLNSIIKEHNEEQIIGGHEIFTLYDTHGLPPELTQEVAKTHNFQVDMIGFEQEMADQRQRSKIADTSISQQDNAKFYADLGFQSAFLGYEEESCNAEVLYVAPTENTGNSSEVAIILSQTTFYPEGGGQIGDSGTITSMNAEMNVSDSQRFGDVIVHTGNQVSGKFETGDIVNVSIDTNRRLDISRNHTATHLLHSALREVLGTHVRQAGSYVGPEYFRFDYTHTEALSDQQIDELTAVVNSRVRSNIRSLIEELPYDDAISKGAIAFFEDRYTENVRMVEYCDSRGHAPVHEHADSCYSRELCGGTHVPATGLVGHFIITSDSSIGAGMRRIEASTGRAAESELGERMTILKELSLRLQTNFRDIPERINQLEESIVELRKRLKDSENKSRLGGIEELINQAEEFNGHYLLVLQTDFSSKELREISDILRNHYKSCVLILTAMENEKIGALVAVTSDLVELGLSARTLTSNLTTLAGGKGGGRAELAQAGGCDSTKLGDALIDLRTDIKDQLESLAK